ncbi:hypothetical protein [Ruminococcus sp. Marseille-P6503]|nr:hypothetical protein [Ruminococcus sp. Marseille-P6503]
MKIYIIELSDRYGFERTATVRAKSIAEAISGVYKSSGEFVLSCRELDG